MADDKRKLTEKELKRKNDFEKISSEMQQKGYKIKNMTINIRQANFLGPLSMLPFIALTFLFYYNVNSFDLGGDFFEICRSGVSSSSSNYFTRINTWHHLGFFCKKSFSFD